MPRRILTPGVYVREIPTGLRSIKAVETANTVFIGWSPTGPTDQVVQVGNFADYERTFGGLYPGSLLGHAVEHFFGNGGGYAHIIRIGDNGDCRVALSPSDPAFREKLIEVGKGIHLLDQLDLFNLLCVPGISESAMLHQLQDICRKRRAFLIMDCAETDTASSLATGAVGTLAGSDAMNAALYFPWIKAPNPLNRYQVQNFPPSGFVAGMIARMDQAHGVWKAPAGTDAVLNEASGPAQVISNAENNLLNSSGINCIRSFPSLGTLSWGARTMHGQDTRGSEWKYLNVRRTALFIEESLYRGLQWVVFEPNDENLWARMRQQVEDFMDNLYRKGAFQEAKRDHAFFVKCSRETTTKSDIDRGLVNLLVGFAPLKPAEFVILKLSLKAASGA